MTAAETPPVWPEDIDHLWAKSAAPGEQAGQSLAAHTWEALCRLRELAALRPRLPALVELPRLWHLLFWATWLHDWGKVARGFQRTVRGGRRWPFRHEVLSLAFVGWVSTGLSAQEQLWLAAAVATHHRDLADILDAYLLDEDPEDDPILALVGQLRRADVERLWQWLHDCGTEWLQALEFGRLGVSMPKLPAQAAACEQVLAAGGDRIRQHLLALDDLLLALEEGQEHSLQVPGILLRGGLVQADHLASAASGPLPAASLGDAQAVLAAVRLTPEQLYAHQRQAQRVGHLLLSAPTGSGKTEAALLWAVRQGVPRLFYALPYQASMNAMYDRLERIFGRRVGLLHGRSTLSLYQRLMERDYTPAAAARLARMQRDLAGLPYYPVRVFSPYQMLKAAFQLKGYEAMLADYAEAAFVFDEVHAYEPGRLAMILSTIKLLAERFAARFLIMSATLPGPVRQVLQETLQPLTVVRAEPALYRRFRRHRLHLLDGELLEPAHLQRMAEDYQAGRQVLVVCNTVARAQEAWAWFRERLPADAALVLLHGRFNARDRGKKERLILDRAGMGQSRRAPVLLVATQVVEVSLNLDLDVLYSDPAPLEALWQRFGRVNRQGRMDLAPVMVFRLPDDGQHIYEPALIENTLALLAEATRQGPCAVDEALAESWLDQVYSGEALAAWKREYQRAATTFQQEFLDALRPFQAQPGLADLFDRLFDGLEVLPEPLLEEYQALRESEQALEASRLLVPIRWGQYHMLANQGLVTPGDRELPPVALVSYDQELGMRLGNG